MKKQVHTVDEWRTEYNLKKSVLEKNFEEVSPMQFYRELFPEGSFQKKGDTETRKANGICTTIITTQKHRYMNVSIMTDELEAVESYLPPKKKPRYETTRKLALIAPCSFYGKHKSKDMMHELYALVIDLDYVDLQKLRNLLKQFGNGARAIPPTYLVSSGRGLHLYYFLEKPLPMYRFYEEKITELKKELIRYTWNETTSLEEEKDIAGVSQAFRAVGSETKLGTDYITRAYKVTGNRYTVEQIAEWIGSKINLHLHSNIEEYRKNHVTLEKAKELYPKWYEEKIIQGNPKRGKWTCKRDLYDWWIKKVKSEAKVGGRYYSIMALAAYGSKCEIPEKEIQQDAYSLIEHLESLTNDELNHFTKKDVDDALKAYKNGIDNLTFKLTREHIEETTKIDIPKNKRNYRKQSKHLQGARAIRDINNPNWREGNGRPDKAQIVAEWRSEHPDGKKASCIRDTGLDKKTVYKWWNPEEAISKRPIEPISNEKQAKKEAVEADQSDLETKSSIDLLIETINEDGMTKKQLERLQEYIINLKKEEK